MAFCSHLQQRHVDSQCDIHRGHVRRLDKTKFFVVGAGMFSVSGSS
jgi:hypothetical protein